MSPICVSSHAELNDSNIDYCENYLEKFIQRWFDWLDEAEDLPVEKRDEQQKYDYAVRELGYRNDPMNILPIQVFGQEEANRMLEMRIGIEQIAETKGRWAK